MYITNIKKTKCEKTPTDTSMWWLLSEKNGVPNFELRYFELEKDQHTPYHTHDWEHEIYIVKGQGIVKGKDIKGVSFEVTVGAGDALFIAPNEEHNFFNEKEETLGFICVVPKGTRK